MGPGVGLSISRKLATSMHGDINAKSEVGVGSVFTFKCVLDAAPPAEGYIDIYVFFKLRQAVHAYFPSSPAPRYMHIYIIMGFFALGWPLLQYIHFC